MKIKRTVSMLLAIMMVVGIFAALPFTASADTTYDVKNYSQLKQALEKNEDCTVRVQQGFSESVSQTDRIVINGGNIVLDLNVMDPLSITAEGDVAFCNLITIKGGTLTIKGMSRIKYTYNISSEYASTRQPSAVCYVDGGTLKTTNCELFGVSGSAVKVNKGTAVIGSGSNLMSQANWAVTDTSTGSGTIRIASKASITSVDQMGYSSQGTFEGYGALCLNSSGTSLDVSSASFGGGVQLKTKAQTQQFSPLSKQLSCDGSELIGYELLDNLTEAVNNGHKYYWYTYNGTYYYLDRVDKQDAQSGHPDMIYVNYYKDGDYKVNVDGGVARTYRGYGSSSANVTSADSGDEIILVADNLSNFDKWQIVSGTGTISEVTKASTFLTVGSSDITVKAVYKEGITSVAVTNVSQPVAGQLGNTFAGISDDADYKFSEGSDNAVSWWHNNRQETGALASGTAYEARVVLSVKNESEKFSENVTASINGLTASVIRNEGSFIVISREFPMTEGTPSADTSDFTYKTNETGVTITGYTGSDSFVEIPSVIDSYNVTEIGNAFMNNSSIVSVNIPDSVTTIGNSAFYNCSNLRHVTIPEGVKSIGSNAFAQCKVLEEVVIPSSVEDIKTYAFDGCTALTDVILSEGLRTIGVCAFYNCQNLTVVSIPKTVNYVGLWSIGFYDVDGSGQPYGGIKIIGYTGSAAEVYANDTGFAFESCDAVGEWSDWMLYKPATVDDSGMEYRYNLSDPSVEEYRAIPQIASVKYSSSKFTYNGKARSPKVTAVTDLKGNKLIEGTDYTVSYYDGAVNVREYVFTVFFQGKYAGSYDCDFRIVKAANPITVKVSAKTVKLKTVKKRNVTVTALTVKKNQGKVTYKKTSGNKKITVNSKTGKLTVKKGLKKGTYKVKVKITSDGNKNFKKKSLSKTVQIKVK